MCRTVFKVEILRLRSIHTHVFSSSVVRVRLPPVLLLIVALRAVNQHVNTQTSRQSFTPKRTATSQSRNILWATLLSLGKPAIREFFDLETVKFSRFYAETILA